MKNTLIKQLKNYDKEIKEFLEAIENLDDNSLIVSIKASPHPLP